MTGSGPRGAPVSPQLTGEDGPEARPNAATVPQGARAKDWPEANSSDGRRRRRTARGPSKARTNHWFVLRETEPAAPPLRGRPASARPAASRCIDDAQGIACFALLAGALGSPLAGLPRPLAAGRRGPKQLIAHLQEVGA